MPIKTLDSRWWLGIASVFVALTLLIAQPVNASIQTQVEGALRGASLGNAKVGIHIIDLTNSVELASVNSDELLIPASNMKLVTSLTAMSVLGDDFRFHTRLTTHRSETGKLRLVVIGDGDPAFCDRDLLRANGLRVEDILDAWVEAVVRQGIRQVDELIIDDRVFDRAFYHPRWNPDDYLRRSWAEVAGLNFHGNTLDVMAQPTSPGNPVQVQVHPAVPFLRQTNQATTGATDLFRINRSPTGNDLTFGGSLRHRRAAPFEITVHDAPMLFGRLYADRLQARGIEVKEVRRPDVDERLPEGQLLAQYFSPMASLIKRINTDSQNMFAESLVKRMGHQFTGSPGSWETGAAAMRDDLRRRLGTAAAAIRISDGSGLSRDNAITARNLTRLLELGYADDLRRAKQMTREGQEPAMIFRQSLALAGREGTMRRRFGDQSTEALIFAKSGFINRVTTLSGYVVLAPSDMDEQEAPTHQLAAFRNGERVVAFSLLFNDFQPPIHPADIRRVQERIVLIIDDYLTRTAQRASVRDARSENREAQATVPDDDR
ncbi:MAG: D-alanyl-D-alanine carboxypeptidase/D-alanyl-D-alanine-endopeptidase [Phycisphaeraceae bacterium]|nr:D-alanyl-D-alanine carboxypeptidase/D-alanyl-D-alanine-endopeptidase [Phycisphaeraceae bacterium]